MFGLNLIQFIGRENLIDVPHRIFFLTGIEKLHKKLTKEEQMKAEHPFVNKVFNYYLIKFQKD